MEIRQYYTMIFWRKAENENVSFEDVAKMGFDIMTIFNKFLSNEYRPNFKTVRDIKNVSIYDWSYDSFALDLKQNVNHTKEKIFQELGYSMNFFSSLNNNRSVSYSLSIGKTNINFTNSIIVQFPVLFDYFNEDIYNSMKIIFYKVVERFSPYFACVVNSKLKNNGHYLGQDLIPNGVHWLNYWSQDILNSININKLLVLKEENPEFSYNDGIIQVKNSPLNADIEDDVSYIRHIEDILLKKWFSFLNI